MDTASIHLLYSITIPLLTLLWFFTYSVNHHALIVQYSASLQINADEGPTKKKIRNSPTELPSDGKRDKKHVVLVVVDVVYLLFEEL